MINICLEDALNSVFFRIQTRAVIIDGQPKVADNPKLGKRRGLGFVMWLLAEDEWEIFQVHEFTYDLFNKSYLPQSYRFNVLQASISISIVHTTMRLA